MGRSFSVLVGLCLALLVVPSLGSDYTVGDSAGWTLGTDYTTWVADKTFKVGDNLVFKYGSGHTVDEVKSADYSSCTTGNSISSETSGSTTIPLKTAGVRYFICGITGHCGSGMKLSVKVIAASSPGTPTAPTATTTTTPGLSTTPNNVPESSSAPHSMAIVPAVGVVFVSWASSVKLSFM